MSFLNGKSKKNINIDNIAITVERKIKDRKSLNTPPASELSNIKTDLISDRVMSVIVRINKETFSIVGVYEPTQVRALADENEEITFIDELQSTIDKQPKNTTLIFLNDFNAKLGNKKNMVTGSFGRGKQNSNGTFLYKLLSTKKLIATNTCFKQKTKNIRTRKCTRKIGNKLIPIFNTIDYIIIPAKHKWRIVSAKSHNRMQTLSDHRLVKTAFLNTKPYQIHSKSN